ncbi:MAG TPA: hypothetical protein VIM73_09260, partial [Polyangiaceae bacterium]
MRAGCARPSALALASLIAGCSGDREIDLGDVASRGGGGGDVSCGPKPCANHTGTKVFVEGNVPPDVADLFHDAEKHPPGSDPALQPVVVYPSHETMFPVNVSRILHEWASDLPDAWFELAFEGPRTRVLVYTDALRFVPSEEHWDWIAESNRGTTVNVEVTALDPANPSEAHRSESIAVSFSDAAVEGAIYFWSTAAEGVMKALVGDATPIKFYADPNATEKATCVGCHTLSRDGKRLAVAYDGERLQEISVADRGIILPPSASGAGGGDGMTPNKADPKAMMPAA